MIALFIDLVWLLKMDSENQKQILKNSQVPYSKGFSQIDVTRITLAQLLQNDNRNFWSRATLSTLGLLGILFGIFLIFAMVMSVRNRFYLALMFKIPSYKWKRQSAM